jgi:hypothetical protein
MKQSQSSPKSHMKNIGKEIVNTKFIKNVNYTNVNNINNIIQSSPHQNKSPILVKDKINFSPGYGLWCIPVEEKKYQSPIEEIVCQTATATVTGIGLHPTKYEEINQKELVANIDKKIIEQLKSQISDLINKLEMALGKFYDADFKATRAEELRMEYLLVTNQKIKEHKEINVYAKSLEDDVAHLNEALSNSKREVSRLMSELKNERIRYEMILKSLEGLKKEYKENQERLEKDILMLREHIKIRDTKFSEIFENPNLNNNANNSNVSNILNNFINIGTKNLKNKTEIEKSKKNVINSSCNENSNTNVSENILKCQLEIVDLKKKISDDEIQKSKLLEIIKQKKEKIRVFKSDFSKLVLLFDESSKEVKWNQDIVNQKNSMIKVLKDNLKKKEIQKSF